MIECVKCVKHDDVWQMLHGIGGCGSKPDTWEAGWDEAINAAISELDKLPTVELMEGSKVYLKSCPFCGGRKIRTEFFKLSRREYKIEIGCEACDYHMTTVCNSKRDCASLDEILEFSREAIDRWNKRYNESNKEETESEDEWDDSEVEENA